MTSTPASTPASIQPQPSLNSPFRIAGIELPNRIMLAPLAGIGNWFVRRQARRYGAGFAVSEMVSSYAIGYGNDRTIREMLRIEPDEHPVAVQLFGNDPEIMRQAAGVAAGAGADIIDLNMGCPVPKVMKTGAGAALLRDHDLAVRVATAAAEGSGLPVTVKMRSGIEPGDTSGYELALRLAAEGCVSAIGFHPRSAAVHHKGRADYALARRLVEQVDVPIIVSGGLRTAEKARRAYEESGAAAIMIARGSLGNPWIFAELTGERDAETPPDHDEVVAELTWLLEQAEIHWGVERGARNLRKFYPWYLERLGISGPEADRFQRTENFDEVRTMLAGLERSSAGAGVPG